MPWRKLLCAALALASLAACGARSPLGGGATSGGSSSSGTSSSGGGSPPSACVALTETGPYALGEHAGFDVRRPALSLLSDDRVAVVFGLDPIPPGGNRPLADVALSPWGAWPPAFTDVHELGIAGSGSFVLGPRPATAFSVLYDLEGMDVSSGMVFSEDVDVMGFAAGTMFDTTTGTALLVASQGNRHLVGVDHVTGGMHDLDLHVFSGGVPDPTSFFGHACGNAVLAGAGIPFGAGVLAAVSSSVPYGDCPAAGAPEQIQILQVSLTGPTVTPIFAVQLGSAIERLALVPSGSGAWLLSETSAGVVAEQLDHVPQPVSGPFVAAPSGSHGFAAAPIGGGFALAWIDPGDATIHVAVFGPAGQAASAEIALEPQAVVDDPLALVTAADGVTLLLAWSEKGAGMAAQILVARFACVGGA